jgi:2-hydroxychromene-2-carboxylate isomerase
MTTKGPAYLPILQIFASIDCPFAYLATFRLHRVAPEYEDRVRLYWRALPLEYINQAPFSKAVMDRERILFAAIEPELPWNPWRGKDWQWPTTFWPAFEALACAQAQGADASLAFSWALRHAFFAEGRNISMRHELMAIAEKVAAEGYLYFPRFQNEWDTGRWKHTILKSSWEGWRELKLAGSVTFVLPSGRQVTNPAIGEYKLDRRTGAVLSYTPVPGDPLDIYRQLFEETLHSGS